MNRRQALAGVAAVGGVSLAGCSSALGSEGVVLGKIEVVNASSATNRIRLMVERYDESIVDRTISLPAVDAPGETPGVTIEPFWSDRRGQYTVRAVHYDESGDRETEDRAYTFTREDYDAYYEDSHEDPGCIAAVVKVGSLESSENGAIGIGPTYVEHPCGTPDSR